MVRESMTDTDGREDRGAGRSAEDGPVGPAADDLVETDLLIEDVSIDGMCGVY